MKKNKHFDVIVLGTGLLGIACTNLLSQLNYKVLNIGLKATLPVQKYNASLLYQGWLISGTTWYFEPIENLPAKFYRQFQELNERLSSSQEFNHKALGIAILEHKQLQQLREKKTNVAPFTEITNRRDLNKLLQQKINSKQHFIKLLDKPYRSSSIMNAMNFVNTNKFNIEQQFLSSQAKLSKSKNKKGYKLYLDGQEFKADKLFVCTGVKSFELLAPIFNIEQQFLTDKKLKTFGFKEKFSIKIIRTPLIAYKNNLNLAFDLLVDMPNRLSIAKHPSKNNLVFATSKAKFCYNLNALNVLPDTKKDKKLETNFTKEISEYYPSLIKEKAWFCNRLERLLISKQNNLRTASISNWAGTIPNYESIVLGIPGKGSLAFDTAKQMVQLITKQKVDFALDFTFPPDYNIFQCHFDV